MIFSPFKFFKCVICPKVRKPNILILRHHIYLSAEQDCRSCGARVATRRDPLAICSTLEKTLIPNSLNPKQTQNPKFKTQNFLALYKTLA